MVEINKRRDMKRPLIHLCGSWEDGADQLVA